MSGAYPDGTTQAMHDRAFADEDRDICPTCGGKGFVNLDGTVNNAFQGCDDDPTKPCSDCRGTGFEQPADTREDDAYEQSREDADIDF